LSCSAGIRSSGARFCRDLQQAFCTDVGHRRHGSAAISFDQKMIRRRKSQQHHCSVCAVPEPRLSTLSAVGSVVQRGGCGAPGAAARRHARLNRAPLPRSVSPLCPTFAPVKANGAARKAHERDKRATETRLRGWHSNSEMSSQIIPLKTRTDFRESG
jgi:hypothetical protein